MGSFIDDLKFGDKVYHRNCDGAFKVGTFLGKNYLRNCIIINDDMTGTSSYESCIYTTQEMIRKHYIARSQTVLPSNACIDASHNNSILYSYRDGVARDNPEAAYKSKTSVRDFLDMNVEKEPETMKDDKLMQFLNGFKQDATKAGYRVGATQISVAMKKTLVAAFSRHGADGDKLAQFSLFLDSDLGGAMISMALGSVLPQLPERFSENVHVEKIGEELRINGMSTVGNLVMDEASDHLMPALNAIFSALPKEDEEQVNEISRVRLSDSKKSVVDTEEQEAEAPIVATAGK